MIYLQKILLASFLLFVIGVNLALADSITFYNTGLAANGTILAPGAQDPNYTLISASDGGSYIATAMTQNAVWTTPTDAAGWISPGSSGDQSWNAAYYVYQTTLDLTGYDPGTAVLSGDVAADNHIFIYLNGSNVFSSDGFSSLTPFSLDSGFTSGINTIDFVVRNDGGPTGLLVDDTSAEASPTPEPSSFLLLGTGLLVTAATVRRRIS